MFLLITFILTAVVFITIKLWKAHNFWKNKGIPQETPFPFLGIMLPIALGKKVFAEMSCDIYNKHPNDKYFGCYMFMEPVIMIRDPDLIKQICVRDFDSFSEHRTHSAVKAEPLVPKTLFASNVERWRQLRPAMSPAFTGSKMKILFSIVEECTHHYMEFFAKNKSERFDAELKDVFTRFTNDIIATTAFGIECDSITHRDNEFYRMGGDLSKFTGLAALKFFLFNAFPKVMEKLKFKLFPVQAMNYFNDIITKTLKQREQLGVYRPDIIQLLLEERKTRQENPKNKNFQITYDDILAQALMFLLGGYETTSNSLSFTVYELAVQQEIQERLREEIDEVWNNRGEKLSFDAISQMKYMDMVISEGLRKYPPMFVMDRKCTRPYTLEPHAPNKQPLKINPGEQIMISSYAIQRDEHYFPDPDRFDPERFSDENKSKIYPGSYIPFGIGPRNCLGGRFALMVMKTFLFHLLRNFEIVPNEYTQIPLVLSKTSVFLMGEKGFHVDFKKRHVQ